MGLIMKPGWVAFVMSSALAGAVFGMGGCRGNGASAVAGARGDRQSVCPVMGGQVDKSIFVDYAGRRIYLCCPACVEVFKRDPERYAGGVQEKEGPLE